MSTKERSAQLPKVAASVAFNYKDNPVFNNSVWLGSGRYIHTYDSGLGIAEVHYIHIYISMHTP
jgi:hypothetical protein